MKIYHYKSLNSTNIEAEKLIKSGIINTNFSVVNADFQENGKGQQGNFWYSSANKNLLFSIVLFPQNLKVERFFDSTKIVSLAVIKYLKTKGIEGKIKWPNDILINDKKVCGILIENTLLGENIRNIIIGIGLNINEEKFPEEISKKASSLFLELKKYFDLNSELNELLNIFKLVYNYDKVKIDELYHQNLFRLNEEVKYIFDGQQLFGINKGVASNGQLIMLLADGKKHNYSFKEIEWII
ncbi:MAG: biotin--[acetyl-CoA-carboxylase] ligase [Bacteroidales bacterium]|nr:biotin--[acetyl-CoA-carboxylase] ligase [Bacteroidales bacterium]